MNHKRFIVIVLLVIVALWALPAPVPAQDAPAMPLAEKGPYGVGVESLTFVDDSREGRELPVMIWYPAEAGRSSYLMPEYQAAPDMTGAPYPLVFYSHYLGGSSLDTMGIGSHLASYGFVVASIDHQDPDPAWPNLIHRPLDILSVLDQIAAMTEGDLSGVANPDIVGVTGYSFGAITTLLLNGATMNTDYLMNWCAENMPDDLAEPPPDHTVLGRVCVNDAARWDEIIAYRAQYDPTLTEDGPWFSDPRIRAALPIALCSVPHWGPDGLATAVPTLYLLPETEEVCGSEHNVGIIRESLTSPDYYLLIVLGTSHDKGTHDSSIHPVFKQFETAFFGYYLQGNEDYVQYLTADYVGTLENVTWESSVE